MIGYNNVAAGGSVGLISEFLRDQGRGEAPIARDRKAAAAYFLLAPFFIRAPSLRPPYSQGEIKQQR